MLDRVNMCYIDSHPSQLFKTIFGHLIAVSCLFVFPLYFVFNATLFKGSSGNLNWLVSRYLSQKI